MVDATLPPRKDSGVADRLTISKPSFCSLQSPVFQVSAEAKGVLTSRERGTWSHGLCVGAASV